MTNSTLLSNFTKKLASEYDPEILYKYIRAAQAAYPAIAENNTSSSSSSNAERYGKRRRIPSAKAATVSMDDYFDDVEDTKSDAQAAIVSSASAASSNEPTLAIPVVAAAAASMIDFDEVKDTKSDAQATITSSASAANSNEPTDTDSAITVTKKQKPLHNGKVIITHTEDQQRDFSHLKVPANNVNPTSSAAAAAAVFHDQDDAKTTSRQVISTTPPSASTADNTTQPYQSSSSSQLAIPSFNHITRPTTATIPTPVASNSSSSSNVSQQHGTIPSNTVLTIGQTFADEPVPELSDSKQAVLSIYDTDDNNPMMLKYVEALIDLSKLSVVLTQSQIQKAHEIAMNGIIQTIDPEHKKFQLYSIEALNPPGKYPLLLAARQPKENPNAAASNNSNRTAATIASTNPPAASTTIPRAPSTNASLTNHTNRLFTQTNHLTNQQSLIDLRLIGLPLIAPRAS